MAFEEYPKYLVHNGEGIIVKNAEDEAALLEESAQIPAGVTEDVSALEMPASDEPAPKKRGRPKKDA